MGAKDCSGEVMGDIEIHTDRGWVNLQDIIVAKDQCTTCGSVFDADGAGYLCIDPILFYCRKCRKAFE